jgi:hypothetical protein
MYIDISMYVYTYMYVLICIYDHQQIYLDPLDDPSILQAIRDMNEEKPEEEEEEEGTYMTFHGPS